MTTRPTARLFGAVALAALLAACGSTTDLKEKAPVETRKPTTTSNTAANPGSGGGSAVTPIAQRSTGVETASTASLSAAASPALRVVYFDFDSYVVKDEFRPVIEGHAKALTAARNRKLMIEGHTDERGGSEYNLALGQKRAEAVVKSLALLGVADNQMEAVSFGKERPADSGHDEAAWAKNRRAELRDK